LFLGLFLEKRMAAMAHITPRKSSVENGSDQKKAPERVGIINPMEYTVEHNAVFPVESAAV
jgi:hypothetical protein